MENLGKINTRYTGEEYLNFLNSENIALYAWKRQDVWLYIGITANSTRRLLYHNRINKIEPVLPGDEILIWRFPELSYLEVEIKEKQLIAKYKPKYNSGSAYNVGDDKLTAICLMCDLEFKKGKPWQKFCSTSCREGNIKGKNKKGKSA